MRSENDDEKTSKAISIIIPPFFGTHIHFFNIHLIFLLLLLLARICPGSTGDAPTISEHPLDILVVKGDPATLRCATSGENVEVNWYKDGELVKMGSAHRLILPNGSLLLLKVNNGGADSEAGTYYCVAKNEFGEVRSQEANVRIASLRDEFRANPHAVQALIGSNAVLECSPPKGFPEPVVTWRKDEKDVNFSEESRYKLHPSGNFIIENVQQSDAGFYQCSAANMVGERTSKPARLSVYEKPRFLAEPKDLIAEVNSSVLFNCKVSGEPMPSISWKKKNDQMPIGRAYVTKDSHGLRIDRIQPEDAGEYICLAKNPVGNIETSAKLRVNSPPRFTKYPENVRLNGGQTAVFECEAAGQPQPGIFWSKEGDQEFTFFAGLMSVDGRIQVAKDGRLIIDNVRAIDEGNYVCAAVNSAGSTLAKASLNVISSANPSHPPPVIMYGHQNQTLMVNDMAILPCQATGRVPATIAWFKDEEQLNLSANLNSNEDSPNVRFRQLVTGTLQILDLSKSDTGVYTCRARNEDGEASWTASLIVEEHTNPNTIFQRMPEAGAFPSAPGRPKVLNASEDTVDLEWSAPERHGATPIIGYILQYWSPGLKESWTNVLDVVSSSRFRVKRLRPNHSYAFVVRAENSKGIGPPSEISEIATTKFSTSDAEKDRVNDLIDLETARKRLASEQLIKLQEVKPINSTAILLTWRHQRREPLVDGYYIKWRGPPLSPDHSWVNVTDPGAESVVVAGLRPANHYEFFVIPYHQSVQGMPSNSLDGTTSESVPSQPPSDVRLRMLNVTSLRVSWRPPPADAMNGILKGFLINIKSNQSEERNITTNERATSVTLYRLIADASYAIRVAARTSAGYGPFFVGQPVVMNEETLQNHLRQASDSRHFDAWYKQPLSVLIVGIILWCIFLLLIVLVWYRCCHRRGRRKNLKDATKDAREFIKIRDGSVVAIGSVPNGCANSGTMARNAAFWAGGDYNNTGSTVGLSAVLGGGSDGNATCQSHENSGGCAPGGCFMGACSGGGGGSMCGNAACTHHHHYGHHSHAQNMFEGGTTECMNCTAAYGPESDYGGAAGVIPFYGINGGICNPTSCSTLQKSARSHSPSHHYHYAQLPEHGANDVLSTFYNQSTARQYYDDPSPYATTTLVMNGSATQAHTPRVTQRIFGGAGTLNHPPHHHHHHPHPLQNQAHPSSHGNLAAGGNCSANGPLLPLNPIPKEPPRNFLSNVAVGATANTMEEMAADDGCDHGCDHGSCCDHLQQNHASSCGALLELSTTASKMGSGACANCAPLQNVNKTINNNAQQCCTIADNQISQCCVPGATINGGRNIYHSSYDPFHHHSNINKTEHRSSSQTRGSGIATRGSISHLNDANARNSHRLSSKQNANRASSRNSRKNELSSPPPPLLSHDSMNANDYPQNHRNSPYTDVSYIQSSDGTNGSSKGRSETNFVAQNSLLERLSPPGNILDLVPPPPPSEPPITDANNVRHTDDGNAMYDAVAEMSAQQKFVSSHQKAFSVEFTRNSLNNGRNYHHRKADRYSSGSMSRGAERRLRNSKNQIKSRLSLIERDDDDDEGENFIDGGAAGGRREAKCERDPLLSGGNNYEDAEADGEMSEEEARLPSCDSNGYLDATTAAGRTDDFGDDTTAGDASSDFVMLSAMGMEDGRQVVDEYFSNNFANLPISHNTNEVTMRNNNNNNCSDSFSSKPPQPPQQQQKQQHVKTRKPMMGLNASTLSQNSVENALNRMSAPKVQI